jgi:Ca2+-binding RTX toxin-like protein
MQGARRVRRCARTFLASSASLAAFGCVGPSVAAADAGACDGAAAQVRGAKVVRGGPGDDVLIGSGRAQRFLGRGGADRICGGGGNDEILGQGGDDRLHGDGRGDRLFGGAGADRLWGDILDDFLFGGGGADALIGGHGVDKMFGGGDADLLRGGTNRDCFYGQDGADTASFATATPPGEPGAGVDGVSVDLARPSKGACPRRGAGTADGDGSREVLDSIQFVVGSSFADAINGLPGTAVDAGLGSDSCTGFAVGATSGCGADSGPAAPTAQIAEPATTAPPDPGLVVLGGGSADTFAISGAGAGALVAAGGGLGAGPGCNPDGTCTPRAGPLAYVLVYGDAGADAVSVGAGLDPSVTVDLDGGPGDDALTGGDYLGEVLFGGDSPGADSLTGNGGDDALVSEGGAAAGPDSLAGGGGDDQLVTDHPCAGHAFAGGAGVDVAGFARADVGIRARLGGDATLVRGGCGGGRATSVGADNEVLEGTPKGDLLIGSGRGEQIWGREGDDVLIGRGGPDLLRAFAGRDLIIARDGRRDPLIQCGSGRDRPARVDRADPRPLSC